MEIKVNSSSQLFILGYSEYKYPESLSRNERHGLYLDNIMKVLNCFVEEDNIIIFDSNEISSSFEREILFKTHFRRFPFYSKKRRTQRWFLPKDRNEIQCSLGLGFLFTCAIARKVNDTWKIKYLIKAYEGFAQPNYLKVLSRSGDNFKKRVLPKLLALDL